jgi:DNA-binding CsgD family transcriptional regulator
VARKRPTASNVLQPSLTCLDGGRPDVVATPLTPLRPPQRVESEIETITVSVRSLLETVEERLRSVEGRADSLREDFGALRVSLTRIESKVDTLAGAQQTIDARLDALRADLSRHEQAGRRRSNVPCPLSSREVEVLARLAEGKVYKQIALELSLSTSTVRTHLHNIYGKLGAVDRAQTVLLATERGWL